MDLITIPSNPDVETLISAIDMIIEAQDNGYAMMITCNDETNAFLYKDVKNFKITANVLGVEVDLIELRRKALKIEQ